MNESQHNIIELCMTDFLSLIRRRKLCRVIQLSHKSRVKMKYLIITLIFGFLALTAFGGELLFTLQAYKAYICTVYIDSNLIRSYIELHDNYSNVFFMCMISFMITSSMIIIIVHEHTAHHAFHNQLL